MVQIHTIGPSRKELLREQLGMTLGKGLSDFTNTYFAGKALDNVLTNNDYENAPQSERASRLEQAMRPYGEYGAKMLQGRMGIEQQVAQEKQQKLMEKKAPLIAKALRGEQLTPQEESLFTPDEQLAIAKHKQAVNKPVGGLSGQAVPPEVSQAIPQILNANKEANADELATAFDSAGIPRTYSNSYVENRRRQDEAKAKSIPESFKETREERKKIIDQGKAYFDTKIRLDRMEDLNKQDKLSTPTMATALEKVGLPTGILGNPNSEEFEKLSQDLFKNIQSVFGNRILKIEVDNFAKTIPTLKNSKEGRQRIINNMRLLGEGQKLAYEAYKDIMKGRSSPPLDLMEQIDERVSPQLDEVAEKFKNVNQQKAAIPHGKIKVRSPDGKIGTIPQDQLEAAKGAGYVITE